MPQVDTNTRREYNKLYYSTKKKVITQNTPVDNPAYTDDTLKRIHFARFRRALKSIRNGDANYLFFENLWIQRYKNVILEYCDKIDDYTDYKQAVLNKTKARCDRCGDVFNKRSMTNQYTCGACLNIPKMKGVCYITLDE